MGEDDINSFPQGEAVENYGEAYIFDQIADCNENKCVVIVFYILNINIKSYYQFYEPSFRFFLLLEVASLNLFYFSYNISS